jgi:hypothetical protein
VGKSLLGDGAIKSIRFAHRNFVQRIIGLLRDRVGISGGSSHSRRPHRARSVQRVVGVAGGPREGVCVMVRLLQKDEWVIYAAFLPT